MPKRFRRSKRRYNRRSRRKYGAAKKYTIRKGRKYTAKIPRPIKLKTPSLGFAAICNTTLRYTETIILDPRRNPNPEDGPFGGAGLMYAANSLVAPNLQDNAGVPHVGSLCFSGLEDYSRVYSNYRVNASRIRCRVFPHLKYNNLDHDVSAHLFDQSAYFTLFRTNEIASAAQDAPIQSIDDMRAKGHRFIKVDPSVVNVVEAYGLNNTVNPPTHLATGQTFGVVQGKAGGGSASTNWSSKFCKKDVDNSEKQAFVNERPLWLGGYQLLSLGPYITHTGGAAAPVPQLTDPCAVEVQVTIEADVTFWRKRMFEKRPRLDDIISATPVIDPDP